MIEEAIRVEMKRLAGGSISLHAFNMRTARTAAFLSRPEQSPNARRLLTMLYSLCPIAHLSAFDAAHARAGGLADDARRSKTRAVFERFAALEALAETARVLLLDTCAFTGRTAQGGAVRTVGRIRSKLREALSLLLLLDPAGHAAGFEETLRTAEALFRTLLPETNMLFEEALFGCPAGSFLEKTSEPGDFFAWAEKNTELNPAAALAGLLIRGDKAFGSVKVPLLPSLTQTTEAFEDELFSRMRFEQGFAMAPVWQGTGRLTGALSRARSLPLVRALLAERGVTALTLLAARLADAAEMLRILSAQEDFRPSAVIKTFSDPGEKPGAALGLCETARGLLAHALELTPEGSLKRIRITSPTEWQFSPEGPGELTMRSLVRTLKAGPARHQAETARLIRLALFGLDPCVPIRIQIDPQVFEGAPHA